MEHVSQPVIIQPLKGGPDPYALHRTLYKLRPRFVIMYDCDVAFVRQVGILSSPQFRERFILNYMQKYFR